MVTTRSLGIRIPQLMRKAVCLLLSLQFISAMTYAATAQSAFGPQSISPPQAALEPQSAQAPPSTQSTQAMPGTRAGGIGSIEEQRIDFLTNEIVHKEIDLERYYLRYRAIGTKEARFSRLRYYLLQMASASCTLASNIEYVKLGAEALRPKGATDFGLGDANPEGDAEGATSKSSALPAHAAGEINTERLAKKALAVGLLGTLFDGFSSGVELCSNTFVAAKNVKNGYSPNAAVRIVIGRIKEIDRLMAERNSIVAGHPELKTIAVATAEGRVLGCFRNWCLAEFADIYATVKSTQSSYNVYYVLDIVATSLYVASYILYYKCLDQGKEHLAGPGVVDSIVGDSFTITAAPISAYAGDWLYKYWRKKLEVRLKVGLKDAEDDVKKAMVLLKKEIASADTGILEASSSVQNRISVYLLWSSRYDALATREIVDLRYQSKVALQNEISGPLIGATYMATEVCTAVAFYKYPERPKAGSSLALGGAISSTVGTSASMAITNWLLVDDLRHRRRLRKLNALPEQLLAERLRVLDILDSMIVSPARRTTPK